jgi:hypothetical protein
MLPFKEFGRCCPKGQTNKPCLKCESHDPNCKYAMNKGVPISQENKDRKGKADNGCGGG